jgi:hypothetical protein
VLSLHCCVCADRQASEQELLSSAQAPTCSDSSSGGGTLEGATVATAAGTRPARAVAAAAGREAMLAAENRDLVVRLTATHRKLKLLRSRSQQREALQDAKVMIMSALRFSCLTCDLPVVAAGSVGAAWLACRSPTGWQYHLRSLC